MKRHIRLSPSALMLALAAAYPMVTYGAAGTAQFTAGDVTVRRGSAAPAPLAKGAPVESGDSIVTGAGGIAQIKFSDGGYIGVQPNSQFDITRYSDNGNTTGDSFLVNLARGGMRAITGLIGKRSHANYKVTTNTATVGIRGSSWRMAYLPDGSLSISTEQDAIEVCTASGCSTLNAGEGGIVPPNNSGMTRTSQATSMPPVAYRQSPEIAGNQVNSDGTSSLVPTVPIVQSGLVFGISGLYDSGEGVYADRDGLQDGSAVTLGGKPVQFLSTTNNSYDISNGATSTVNYSAGSVANGDYIVLGSWSNSTYTTSEGTVYPDNYMPLAYVAGVPTPSLSSLSGLVGTYQLAAGNIFNSYGAGSVTGGSMLVNFGSSSATGSISMDVSVPYGGSSNANYSMSGSISGYGTTFSGTMYTSGEGGYADYNGFFSGATAQHAGVSYSGYTSQGGSFAGASVYSQNGLGTPETASGMHIVGAGTSSYGEGINYLFTNGDATSLGGKLLSFYNGDDSAYYVSGANNVIGTSGFGTLADGELLVLGTWGNGFSTYAEGTVSPHAYVVGKPTDNATIVGLNTMSGSYTLDVASPIFMRNGAPNGTLNYANLSVNFDGVGSSGSLNMGASMQYGGSPTSYVMSGMVSGSGATFNGYVQTGEGNYAFADVTGFFNGSGASRVGLSYSGYTNESGFSGAAILSGYTYGEGTPTPPQSGTYNGLASMYFAQGGTGDTVGIAGDHSFDGSALSSSYANSNSTLSGSGGYMYSAGSTDNGDFIGWGKWSSASGYSGGSSVNLTNVHYIVGTPTPQADFASLSGTVEYTRSGFTTPTSTNFSDGQLNSASLTANFGSTPTVNATVNAGFDGNTKFASVSINGMSVNTATAMFSGNDGGNGNIKGLFVGSMASRAGFVYQTSDATLGTVSGAVTFTKP